MFPTPINQNSHREKKCISFVSADYRTYIRPRSHDPACDTAHLNHKSRWQRSPWTVWKILPQQEDCSEYERHATKPYRYRPGVVETICGFLEYRKNMLIGGVRQDRRPRGWFLRLCTKLRSTVADDLATHCFKTGSTKYLKNARNVMKHFEPIMLFRS